MKRKIEDSFDEDPGYDIEPYFDQYDEELSEEQLFHKYIKTIFPKKIGNELSKIYPKFKTDHTRKLKKMVGSSAFFFGPPGTGKTYMACLLVLLSRKNSWLYLDLSTEFYRVAELLDEFRNLLFRRNEIDLDNGLSLYDSLIYKLRRCKYLILDDLGAEKTTDYATEILDRIIDFRYSENKITIVTTNFDVKTLMRAPGYGRIVSRLLDMVAGKPIKLTKVYRVLEINPVEF